jgi:hypothetical protein
MSTIRFDCRPVNTAAQDQKKRSCILRFCIDNAADAALTLLNGAPATIRTGPPDKSQTLLYNTCNRKQEIMRSLQQHVHHAHVQ